LDAIWHIFGAILSQNVGVKAPAWNPTQLEPVLGAIWHTFGAILDILGAILPQKVAAKPLVLGSYSVGTRFGYHLAHFRYHFGNFGCHLAQNG